MGSKFFVISHPYHISYFADLAKIFKDNQYDVIHFHLSGANIFPILIACLEGNKNIIIHSHNTNVVNRSLFLRALKKTVHKVFKVFIPFFAQYYISCSDLAGKWMFTRKVLESKYYYVAKNSIDIEKYCYNKKIRDETRKSLSLNNGAFVLGHVGGFVYQKNHGFLIEIFREVYKIHQKSVLLLIGDGEIKKEIMRIVSKYKLNNNVMFLGNRKDVNKLFQAMDCFILPSLYEGLPTVGIEAQASGLPCIMSDCITREVKVAKCVNFISLKCGVEEWARQILKLRNIRRTCMREVMNEKGWNIKREIKNIEKIYLTVKNMKKLQ